MIVSVVVGTLIGACLGAAFALRQRRRARARAEAATKLYKELHSASPLEHLHNTYCLIEAGILNKPRDVRAFLELYDLERKQ